ncbi:hypothetical protein HKCCE2091_10645 [Rhodobacterales bacterium HKCCE2091]|nr:hypothetical protein [Rhodobacterales bacterium HKCCE2091]
MKNFQDLLETPGFQRARGAVMATSAAMVIVILGAEAGRADLSEALGGLGDEIGGPLGDTVGGVADVVEDLGDALNAADNNGTGGLGDGVGQLGGALLGDGLGGTLNGTVDTVGDILNGGLQPRTGGPFPIPPTAFDPTQRGSNGLSCSAGGNSAEFNGLTVVGADGQALGVVHDAIVSDRSGIDRIRFASNGVGTGGRGACVEVGGGDIAARGGEVLVPIVPTR